MVESGRFDEAGREAVSEQSPGSRRLGRANRGDTDCCRSDRRQGRASTDHGASIRMAIAGSA
jgi:hypothetical protein